MPRVVVAVVVVVVLLLLQRDQRRGKVDDPLELVEERVIHDLVGRSGNRQYDAGRQMENPEA